MNSLKAFFLLITIPLAGFAASDKVCSYNEWSGKLLYRYVANEPEKARGWVPTGLALCKDSEGIYAIVTHRAIALGQLADLPVRVAMSMDELKKLEILHKDGSYAFLVNESSSYDEREAAKLFEHATIEAAIVFTGTKDQILVIRKELNQVISNTLFLKDEATFSLPVPKNIW